MAWLEILEDLSVSIFPVLGLQVCLLGQRFKCGFGAHKSSPVYGASSLLTELSHCSSPTFISLFSYFHSESWPGETQSYLLILLRTIMWVEQSLIGAKEVWKQKEEAEFLRVTHRKETRWAGSWTTSLWLTGDFFARELQPSVTVSDADVSVLSTNHWIALAAHSILSGLKLRFRLNCWVLVGCKPGIKTDILGILESFLDKFVRACEGHVHGLEAYASTLLWPCTREMFKRSQIRILCSKLWLQRIDLTWNSEDVGSDDVSDDLKNIGNI